MSSIRKNILFYLSISSILFLISGCTLFTRPPAEPHLKQLSKITVFSQSWDDDLSYDGLQTAIEQSIRYYSKLPETAQFHYNELSYSPEEMIISLRMFMDIISGYDGKERINQLRKKFLFFESLNSSGNSFFTGYYEPILEGTLEPEGDFRAPLYETPKDLVKVDLGQFNTEWKKEKLYGRIDGNRLVPYYSRDEIVHLNSLEEVAVPIAYADEIEVFFLQIQGSGLLRLPDGSLMRLNYASQNGHPYRSIGRFLSDRIPEEEMSLQSLKGYLHNNPDKVRDILSYNQSYVFFREVDEGPLGYLDLPLTPHRSIAMDRKIVPGGGLAYIETELPVFSGNTKTGSRKIGRFVLVQDTGGAIVGHGRVDIFLGHEDDAELVAGHLKNYGRTFLIVGRKEFLDEYLSTDNMKE